MSEHRIQIDQGQCVGCGLCQRDCPENNIVLEQKKAAVLTQSCIKCGHCVAICPRAAVSMTGFEPPVEMGQPAAVEPQQLLAALRSRRSMRQFTQQPIEPALLKQIIEAGRWTPTAKNAQDVSYIVLQEELAECEEIAVRLFRRLRAAAKWVSPTARRVAIDDHFFFKNAPAVIVLAAKNQINGALAASNMALMAEAHGLGVLYSGFFAQAVSFSPALKKRLRLKRREKAAAVLVLGYPRVRYLRSAPREAAKVQWR